tara:strand:+ start:545 stop:706 length:162 start_codon:yes stop_codon:yes gene_type:complete
MLLVSFFASRAAKVRCIGVLASLNDATPDGTGAGEIGMQVITIPLPDGPLQSE